MWNTDICWSFQMDFKATSIYFVFEWLKHCIACSFSTMWMCWAFRIYYMYRMLKDFFIMLCYTRLSQKFNWQVTLFSQAARAMKILQQKEYAYVLCNSIVWKCPVFYVHDFICEMQAQVWSISCSWWNLEAARFHFSFIFYWRHLN